MLSSLLQFKYTVTFMIYAYIVAIFARRIEQKRTSHDTWKYFVYRIKTCRKTIKCFSGRRIAERGEVRVIYITEFI